MQTIKAVAQYWRIVFVRALRRAASVFGTNPTKLISVALFTGIAASLLYRAEGGQAAYAKLEWWLMLLAAELGVLIISFIPFFAAMPYVMQSELEELAATQRKDLEEQNGELKNQLTAVQSHASNQIETLKANAETIKNDDPKKRITRNELKTRQDGFSRIQAALESSRIASVEEFYDLDWTTSEYVRNNVPGYTQYGRKYSPQNTHTKKMRYTEEEFKDFANRCRERIGILQELIEIHS